MNKPCKKRFYFKTLNRKLTMIFLSVFLPMAALAIGLLLSLERSPEAYSDITESVSYANDYVKAFRERIDYSMYLSVTRNMTTKELAKGKITVNGIVTVDPYVYIEELSQACDRLSDLATMTVNKAKIKRLKKSLSSLKKRVAEIERDIDQPGMYDTNMKRLEDNIYSLTEVISGGLEDYIYYETANFDVVKARLEKENERIMTISVIIAALIAALGASGSLVASKSVTRPIRNLCQQADRVSQGDFSARAAIQSGDETAVLTQSFNNMTTQLEQMMEQIKREQENLHLTQTQLLQAQINPHFLYNTLDAIVWLAEQNQSESVVKMVTDLSDFFRTSLSNGHDWVTVREEELHIRSYLEIQHFRYEDVIQYEIHMETSILDYRIPKLTLQPIVENAIYHGIKNKRGGGTIWISGKKEEEKLLFSVRDDGVGMTKEKLEDLRKSICGELPGNGLDSFGMSNVNRRIHYYYGENYGIIIDSVKDQGTIVNIELEAKNIDPKV